MQWNSIQKTITGIHGIPESIYTSTEDAVLKVAQALDVPITADDIDISHKLNAYGEQEG